jgi:hypothetical protein
VSVNIASVLGLRAEEGWTLIRRPIRRSSTMEPRNAASKSAIETRQVAKKKPRFRIVKLEERIAPSRGGNGTNNCGGGGGATAHHCHHSFTTC